MQAFVHDILELLNGRRQFSVPRYQRAYSWKLEQCRQLWDDVRGLMAYSTGSHFTGSVVYVQDDAASAASGGTFQIIDGQQRLTTVTLMLSALATVLREREAQDQPTGVDADEVEDLYLNVRGKGDGRFKLLLTETDRETLMHELEPDKLPLPARPSARVQQNRQFFVQEFRKVADLAALHSALGRLTVVDISLSRKLDNPQLIFESLNSTGLDLTQADLTRNYVLMNLGMQEQDDLYDHFWHPMERMFAGPDENTFDFFVRDYLTVRGEMTQQPRLKDVYAVFKKYVQEEGLTGDMADVVRDMHELAGYYATLLHPEREQDAGVRAALSALQGIELDVWLPLGLHAYEAWKDGGLSGPGLLEVLGLVESYLFRRWAVGLPSQGLNKVFPALVAQVDAAAYAESLRDALYQLPGTRRFPSDEEFKGGLVSRDLYTARSWSRYTLGKLEAAQNKEFAGVAGYTIEHVMPQNKKPSADWRAMLGAHWQEVQDKYLHTLGNLTLTKYNSELSDRPFPDKRDMDGGFRDTGLRISRTLRDLDVWNEAEIVRRAAELAEQAVKVWPALQPTEALRARLQTQQAERAARSAEDFLRTASPALRELFEQVRDGLTDLHAEVQEVPLATYIAYKVGNNFTDLIPQPGNDLIRATLNLPFAELNDPQGVALNVAGKNGHGNGEAAVLLRSPLDLPAFLDLARQALEYQLVRRKQEATEVAGGTIQAYIAALTPERQQAIVALEQALVGLDARLVPSRTRYYVGYGPRPMLMSGTVREGAYRLTLNPVAPDELTSDLKVGWTEGRGEVMTFTVRTPEDIQAALPLIGAVLAQRDQGQWYSEPEIRKLRQIIRQEVPLLGPDLRVEEQPGLDRILLGDQDFARVWYNRGDLSVAIRRAYSEFQELQDFGRQNEGGGLSGWMPDNFTAKLTSAGQAAQLLAALRQAYEAARA